VVIPFLRIEFQPDGFSVHGSFGKSRGFSAKRLRRSGRVDSFRRINTDKPDRFGFAIQVNSNSVSIYDR